MFALQPTYIWPRISEKSNIKDPPFVSSAFLAWAEEYFEKYLLKWSLQCDKGIYPVNKCPPERNLSNFAILILLFKATVQELFQPSSFLSLAFLRNHHNLFLQMLNGTQNSKNCLLDYFYIIDSSIHCIRLVSPLSPPLWLPIPSSKSIAAHSLFSFIPLPIFLASFFLSFMFVQVIFLSGPSREASFRYPQFHTLLYLRLSMKIPFSTHKHHVYLSIINGFRIVLLLHPSQCLYIWPFI